MKLLISLVCFALLATLSVATPYSCGSYGPRYFQNVGQTMQVSALFAAPLGALANGPFLYGCTPSQANKVTSNGTEYIVYAYQANSFLLSTSHWYINGSNVGNVHNTYGSDSPYSATVIQASQFSTSTQFVNFTFEYDTSTYKLDSISVYSPNTMDVLIKSPITPSHLMHGTHGPLERETRKVRINAAKLLSNNKEETKVAALPKGGPLTGGGPLNAFITFQYGSTNLPYLATNITSSNNIQGTSYIENQYTWNSQRYVTKISQTVTTGSNKQTTNSYIYYATSGLVTKICSTSCINYYYDSSNRLTTISENAKNMAQFQYSTVNGESRIVYANLESQGSWNFTY